MSSYIVFTREKTTDKAELEIYAKAVGSTMVGHPHNVLAAYGEQEVLEGLASEGIVIVEFSSKEEALAWYKSPAYKRRHKTGLREEFILRYWLKVFHRTNNQCKQVSNSFEVMDWH